MKKINAFFSKLFGEGFEWRGYKFQLSGLNVDPNEMVFVPRHDLFTFKIVDGQGTLTFTGSWLKFAIGGRILFPKKKPEAII